MIDIKQINLLNRWQYLNSKKGIIGFASFRFLTDKKDIGQLNFNPNDHKFSESIWGGEIDTEKFDFSIKTGYVNPKIPYRSFGFQSSINYHSQSHLDKIFLKIMLSLTIIMSIQYQLLY